MEKVYSGINSIFPFFVIFSLQKSHQLSSLLTLKFCKYEVRLYETTFLKDLFIYFERGGEEGAEKQNPLADSPLSGSPDAGLHLGLMRS